MGEKNMYKKSKLFEKEGFYIVLFVCLCIVAVTAVYMSRNNAAKQENLAANLGKTNVNGNATVKSTDPLLTLTGEDKNSVETSKQPVKSIDDVKKAQKENIQAKNNEKKPLAKAGATTTRDKKRYSSTRSDTTASAKVFNIVLPVAGEVVKKYDNNELQFAKAINQWETHEGIDIACELGTEIKAVRDGKIIDVKTGDEKLEQNLKNGYGASVLLDHGDGYMTVYSNLSTEGMKVKKGDVVKAGALLGVVGDTSQREAISLEGSHLHFELLKKDGDTYVSINPEKFLKQ